MYFSTIFHCLFRKFLILKVKFYFQNFEISAISALKKKLKFEFAKVIFRDQVCDTNHSDVRFTTLFIKIFILLRIELFLHLKHNFCV